MNNSSSMIGTQEVSTFIAFSKSESSKISPTPSISAAEVACKMSREPLKVFPPEEGVAVVVVVVAVGDDDAAGGGGDGADVVGDGDEDRDACF